MRTVHKFRLSVPVGDGESVRLSVPGYIAALSVGEQYGHICMWCLVDDVEPPSTLEYWVCGTGTKAPPSRAVFRGTVMLHGGQLVAHVFSAVLDEVEP